MTTETLPLSWHHSAQQHMKQHPLTTAGFTVAGLAVVFLLLQSLWLIANGQADHSATWALIGGGISFTATALGALPALLLRNIPQKLEDTMLGFAAGMMLAASFFALLAPGLEAGSLITGNSSAGAAVVSGGIILGVLLMLGLDEFIPHEHDKTGPCGPGHENCNRMLLFVFAIALHNLPEGMAIGVGFSQADMSVGLPLTIAISLQNIPEGLAVALVMIAAGARPVTAVGVAAASALMEPLGAILGVGLASGLQLAYPLGLGLAAGAMLFVVSHEVIPETHRNGHQTMATSGLIGGFIVMMILDATLA